MPSFHSTKPQHQQQSRRMTTRHALCTVAVMMGMMSFHETPVAVDASSEPDTRIVGGEDVPFGNYGFFASWDGSCGATVIHDDILLTAAHCNPLGNDNVVIGAYGRDGNDDPQGSAVRTIKQRFVHPRYDVDSWEFDIMLLKLNEPVPEGTPFVTLNSNVQEPSVGDTVTAVGLGRDAEDNGNVAEVLQEVDVERISQDLCSSMYPGWIIEESMICAGIPYVGQKDACYGDSGGPLLQRGAGTGDVVQVGVVSFGTGCARKDKPGVYSRVSAAYEWIDFSVCAHTDYPGTRCGAANAVREAPDSPSAAPSVQPTALLSDAPSQIPSDAPSTTPSAAPSASPSPTQLRGTRSPSGSRVNGLGSSGSSSMFASWMTP
mmetsp:Transcript_53148/g.129057  ORF Transcript_53148/g.129057 Transcript_53148/m.129057 type:complete len:375 (+) Transcript_53148:205-1329(+)